MIKTIPHDIEKIVSAPNHIPEYKDKTTASQSGSSISASQVHQMSTQTVLKSQSSDGNQASGQAYPKVSEHVLPKAPEHYVDPRSNAEFPTIAAVAAKNVPKSGKLNNRQLVAGKRSNNTQSSTNFPPLTKTSKELKRRVIFHKCKGAQQNRQLQHKTFYML